MLLGVGADKTAEEGHEQRGAHPLITDVADHDPEPPVLIQWKRIIEVARYLTRRLELRRQFPVWNLWQRGRQEALLNAPTNLHIPLDLEQHLIALVLLGLFVQHVPQTQDV